MRNIFFFLYRVFRKTYAFFRMRAWPLLGPVVRDIDRRLFQVFKPCVAQTRFGHTMQLDSKDSLKLSLFGIYEPFALAGAKELLSDGLPLKMVVEFWPEGLKKAGTEPLALVQDLLGYGFELFSIDELAKTLRPIVDVSDEKKIGKNIFCVRQ